MAFKKGQSGNPNGRKKGVPNKRTELLKAIDTVQKKKKKKFLIHVIEQAYKDNKVLIALLKKIVPDLTELSGDLDLNHDISPALGAILERVYSINVATK